MIKNYTEYITTNMDVRFNQPCIKGTRISVSDVLSWYANGMTMEDIFKEYPELKREQIEACFAYAADKE
jgi:uncharacterized protein (DUF433 family)